ncbi:MAG: signal peptide peptidase SppA [Blastocatellia bacterium]|nr:signal peptide peptidase SppA [Blastocatellia bacterium]
MRDFIKQTLAGFTGMILFSVVAIVAVAMFFGVLLAGLTGGSGEVEPVVEDKTVLVFDLSTNISDAKPGADPFHAFQDAAFGSRPDSISLKTVLDTLDKAAKDKRIVGLYLHGNLQPNGYGSGFAALKEIREALQRFRDAGKTITAYNMGYGEREYYLASVSNNVILNPFGMMEMNGFASQPMFYADAFKKYGIGVQVTRVGKYKSAVEPYILNKMSPENREQLEALFGDMWKEFLSGVSASRKVSAEELQANTDEGGLFMADQAKEKKLIDKTAYFDEVVADLKKLTGSADSDQTFRQINLTTYQKVSRKSLGLEKDSKNQVAVVYAEGEIVDGGGSEDSVGGDRLARQLRTLRLDPNVKAIVLRVNSPGGSATASEVIQREVILTKKTKPVVISMGTVAASGGYWIATYGDKIFAEPNTITGSIGVFGMLPNVQGLANEHGITWDTVKTGKYADLGTLTRPKTDEELALIQRTVDRIYDQFLTKVSESRNLPKEKVAEIAQGRVWTGNQAKGLGLVDEIGGLQTAIKFAAEKAKLGADWKIEEYPRPSTTEDKIKQLLSGDDSPRPVARLNPLTKQVLQVKDDLQMLGEMNDPMHVYARMPFNLKID